MIITDVPESGVYYQKGAVVQIVYQFIDEATGDPVQLQVATGLFLKIIYPDRQSTRIFPATLYTDGSDGRIVYTTVNDGVGYADINQTGLYLAQGYGVIGGTPLPPGSCVDFYVLPNAADQVSVPVAYPVLKANDGTFWKIYVRDDGRLDILSADHCDASVEAIYLLDASGGQWKLSAVRTAPDDAHLDTETVNGDFPAGAQFFLADSVKKQWVVTVIDSGNTKTD